jgi:uncharacterized membrane protein YdjX (TVP38/TMEM64 family)
MRNRFITIGRQWKKLPIRPFLPLFLILFLMVLVYAFASYHPLSWKTLREFHLVLKKFEENHPIAAPLLFMSLYIVYAVLSLPGIFFLSLLAGFLFVQPYSTVYVVVAATIGSSLLFLAARTAFGAMFVQYAGRFLNRMEKGFRENAFSYLLFLRLIPLFPFWIVNFAGAFFGVSFWIFTLTTFLGMIPSVFIYTQAGRGFSLMLESPDPLNPLNLFNPNLILALVGLAFLALLPILYNHIKPNIKN